MTHEPITTTTIYAHASCTENGTRCPVHGLNSRAKEAAGGDALWHQHPTNTSDAVLAETPTVSVGTTADRWATKRFPVLVQKIPNPTSCL